jgi:hypothetical protein
LNRLLFKTGRKNMMLYAMLLMACPAVLASDAPADLESLCAEQPARIEKLFEALDLTYPGLENAGKAWKRGKAVKACRELLDYYRKQFRDEAVFPDENAYTKAHALEADALLERRFTFYTVTDEVPLREDGGLDWSWRGPDNDREWAWALNRHFHFRTLLSAWKKTGDEKYIRFLDVLLRDWVLSSPWPGKKSATARWRGLEAALRMNSWTDLFKVLQHNDAFTPVTRILQLSSLPDHAHYLRNYHAGGGNWVTMEMNGLAAIALTWPEFRQAPEWRDYAAATMTPELDDQVYPDGIQKELTSHYHRVAARNFQQFADQYSAAGQDVPARFRGVLEKMWGYLAYSIRPNGYGVLNNDSDYDHTRPILKGLAADYERPDWLYAVTAGTEGAEPDGLASRFFPWAGQAILRSSWQPDAHWCFFDIGPLGTGHVHFDRLHLSIAAHGRDILVDSGRYTYVGGKWRNFFTGSAAHNVLLVDGAAQKVFPAENETPFEDACAITPEYDYVRGSFTSGYRGVDDDVRHHRILLYRKPRYWVVIDRVDAQQPHKITALWHFHPDCNVETDENAVMTTDAGKGNLRIQPLGMTGWNLELVRGREKPSIQGWYSVRYNQKEPATAAVYTADIEAGEAAAIFAWLMIPADGPARPMPAELRLADPHTAEIAIGGGNPETLTIPLFSHTEVAILPGR